MNKIHQLVFLFTATIVLSLQSIANAETLNTLKQLTWKNRILLVKPNTACDQEAKILLADKLQIDDRDIVWFVFCDEQMETNYTGKISNIFIDDTIAELFIRDDVTVILVGKDGGVKRQTDSLELNRLYDLIDSMPMRQSEMQQ